MFWGFGFFFEERKGIQNWVGREVAKIWELREEKKHGQNILYEKNSLQQETDYTKKRSKSFIYIETIQRISTAFSVASTIGCIGIA